MELQGTIIAVMPVQSGVSRRTGNPWQSQEYVIEVPDQYPKRCVFRVFGEDRIKQFNIQQGSVGTVSFDVDAHEYNGRWFNQITAYGFVHQGQQQAVQPQASQSPVPQPAPSSIQPQAPANGSGAAEESDGELPF